MNFTTYSPEELKNSIMDLTRGGLTINVVVALGVFLQIVLVMVLIKSSFRDNHVSRMGWIKALCYSILFVVGAPLIAQICSALLIWGLPFLLKYLDVISLLQTISSIDEAAAAISRPWAYALALLSSAGFLVWRIRSLKRRSFTWIHAGQVVLFAFFANILFQLLVYGILVAVG